MRRLPAALVLLLVPIGAYGQTAPKPPLDHSVYDSWNRIMDQRLSDDGRWILYSLVPQDGDAVLHVRALGSAQAYTVARGRSAEFTGDARHVVFLIKPELALERAAKKEKKKEDEQPKDSLGILDLASGTVTRVERVKSFELPEDAGGWVAYLLEPAKEAKKPEAGDSAKPAEQKPAEPEGKPEGQAQQEDKKKKDKKDGTTLVLLNLATGAERRFERVMEYAWSKDGLWLAYAASAKDGSADGAFAVATADTATVTLLAGEGNYRSLAFDEAGRQLAFLSNRDDYKADQPEFTLYHWRTGTKDVRPLAHQGTAGIPAGWWVSEHGALTFSDDGKRLYFGTAPRPEPEPKEEPQEWEKVAVDVWNWRDPYLQPMQLKQRDDELKRSYRAAVHLERGRVVQLADTAMPELTVPAKGNTDVALGLSNLPYRQLVSWDQPGYQDAYVVNVQTGARRLLLQRVQWQPEISPQGKYLAWWDGHERAYFVVPTAGGSPVNVSVRIPYPVHDEMHDLPMVPSPYGDAGWTEGDARLLVYDRHDVWAVDPTGRQEPRNVTDGVGRARDLELRYVGLDPEQEAIPEDEPILLRAFDRGTKAAGFFRDRAAGDQLPERLVMDDRSFGTPRKAEDAPVLVFTRESFREFPDLWVSDLSVADPVRVSDANPQQANYRWGAAELVHWRSSDGELLDGLLYKPDGFDRSQQYPMMVYFYETMSDGLNRFQQPGPGGSSVSVSFSVSRGYLVFLPDIHYRIGYPGESALDCVVSGVASLIEKGFVDPKRIGVQGHSWGGYQISYLVTQTNIFRAAEAGAPVSNMTSAYGGIRWSTGMSRMFQYERSQSRIGGTLWEVQPRYIANSPIFWADKVETPLLMMHNDQDGAVPWYQGVEYFVALRRLGKPVWLVNYNGEDHGLAKYPNKKDWAIRMQQFFDHYLMDAPAPVWMSDGVPAVRKGRTLGLDLPKVPDPTQAGAAPPEAGKR